jgi:hypothetical protein
MGHSRGPYSEVLRYQPSFCPSRNNRHPTVKDEMEAHKGYPCSWGFTDIIVEGTIVSTIYHRRAIR